MRPFRFIFTHSPFFAVLYKSNKSKTKIIKGKEDLHGKIYRTVASNLKNG